MVRLSDKEIEQLSGALPSDGAYQVMSVTHVMTVCNDIVSKIIYSFAECWRLTVSVRMIPSCDDHLIKPQYNWEKMMLLEMELLYSNTPW